MQKNSVHLQDFPDTSFVADEENLSVKMDLVREVCSAALSIRDSKNLRVRLPLKSLTLAGKNSDKILSFKEIIADEVNVKEVLFSNDFTEFADLKLQLNFKKIGTKFGSKVKEITAALKDGNWQRISENEILIANEKLSGDEFELKMEIKNRDNSLSAEVLSGNDFLVILDTELNKDLINEGIARDLVRIIQQSRREAGLEITDKIELGLICSSPEVLDAIQQFQDYVAEQILAKSVKFLKSLNEFNHQFKIKVDETFLEIGFKL